MLGQEMVVGSKEFLEVLGLVRGCETGVLCSTFLLEFACASSSRMITNVLLKG